MELDLERDTVLKWEYGSVAHGTNTEDSDHDYMGIAVPPREYVTGLSRWDQTQINTAGKDTRSTRADSDTTIYSLSKWCHLAALGNPTVMTGLFVSEYVEMDARGLNLPLNKHMFISQEAGHRFLGYMRGQRSAMTGMRNKRTNRPELIHKHGYDTKFAYHMIRTGMQGIELMTTGRLELPMAEGDREVLLKIRRGGIDKDEVLHLSWTIERDLLKAIDDSKLPKHAAVHSINRLMDSIYVAHWRQIGDF